MSRFDRLLFWLVNRVPIRLLAFPVGLIPWAILRRTSLPFWWQFGLMLVSGALLGRFIGESFYR